MRQLIIALQRGRILFHINLAPVGCVLQKVLQDGHGEVIVVEVDIFELRALSEGRWDGIELGVLHPTSLKI